MAQHETVPCLQVGPSSTDSGRRSSSRRSRRAWPSSLAFAYFALRRGGRLERGLLVPGGLTCPAIVAAFAPSAARWLEWPAVALILVYTLWLGRATRRAPAGPPVEQAADRHG